MAINLHWYDLNKYAHDLYYLIEVSEFLMVNCTMYFVFGVKCRKFPVGIPIIFNK